MAAYSAVISLLQTLDQQKPELFHAHTAEMLDSLRATAQYFQHVLENIRLEPEKIKSLEQKIRVAASEAEDVVEMKISRIVKVSRWTFGILQHPDLLKVVKKMDTTKKQVMEILSHDADDQVLELYGVSLISTSSTSYPILEDDIVRGLDDDLEIIVKRLRGSPRDLDIVTITGMGGIGKTTLAKKAYDHLTIRYHFDILAWVTISQEFRCRNVLLELLHCISKKIDIRNSKDYDKMDDNELADVVQKSLKGRRYLVVVDDIWSRDVWDGIRGIFPDYNNGSRILLTTRETEVAMYANTSSPHEMSLLSLENGWRLLCDKVFGPKHEHPPELEEIGKKIAEKCQGLPLTISVIGGHLSKRARTLEGWKNVARNLSEIIAIHPDKCLGVLGLSYHHLPSHLKPCFLSISSFPEDFEVDTWRLIRLWIAEGFIRTSAGSHRSLEEVAVDYLEDLIGRNLIQARKRRFNGEIKECGIHDLLREFCLIEAEMTKHMHIVERTHPSSPTQEHNVRRFSFQTESYSVADHCNLLLPPVARSIYFFYQFGLAFNPIIDGLFSRFNLLRVLAIFNTDVWFESFPLVITKLFHLRYLQVQFDGDIPESISELQNLRTLICNGHTCLPRKIWMMKNLRYICMKGPSCLPSPTTEHLVTGMPNLEEFSDLSYTSCTKEVFCGIPNLKRLIIHIPLFINKPPLQVFDMSRLTKLEAFKLIGSFYLADPIKRFVFPTSLRRLSLRRCHDFVWADISSTVMMLPNLEELKLKYCRASRHDWRMSDKDKFKSLKLFLLDDVDLEHWEASNDNFPNLKRLILKKCSNLQKIPAEFGEIYTLESIELQDCSTTAEDSARNIAQEQEDMGNTFLKVFIHNSRTYTAVISLLQTLDQRNIPELFHVHTAELLESLHATAQYFQHVLENTRFHPEKIRSLEEKIRVAATEADDVVAMKISQIIESSSWTFEILQDQDLLLVVEKMNTAKKQVMEIVSHDAVDQVLELSGDSLIGTSSTSYPMSKDDIVHGIDDDLAIIVKRLTGPPRDLDVVTISGMGGIGKTTLARKAYDHLTIRYHFDILAWVTISQEFRFRNILLEALHCISKNTDIVNSKDYDKMDDNELADVVQKKLKGRRYLVVVDDIWSRDVWDGIRRIFPNYSNGSRILLTTRETEVATYADTSSPHEVSLLSLENGWRLLCDIVFGIKHEHPPELEEIGKNIVEKCQGLPLTISVIAGHLSKVARTLQGWKDVTRNLTEIIASHPNKCLGVLGLSYYHLPIHLKPCFLSLSIFPEDFQVDARGLIRLWIAEGFIRTSGSGRSLEEVAIDYLEDLISRNLIQVRKRRFNGEIKACGIHDLLREFCLIEAQMTKHMHAQRTEPTLPTQQHNFRRFSFQTEFYSVDNCCKLLPPVARSIHLFSQLDLPFKLTLKSCRILLIYHKNPIIHEFFSHFNLLRVLAISNTYVWFKSFPLVITKLFHLRYLQVEFVGDIPESISELQNLQTLICDGVTSLPRRIWTMKNLRYICMKRPSCLPNPTTEHLVTGMPNLEEFSGLSYTICTKEVFCGIPNLKRLIINIPFFRPPLHVFDMSRLTKLEAFKLMGSFYLTDPIKRFVFPTSLRRLSLSWCRDFDWADISSTVTMLPNLEELKLKYFRASRHDWRMSDKEKFKSLKFFLLDDVDLEHWEACSDNFPNLKRLVLKECHYLQEIPADFGEICTLESIELHDCSTTAEHFARNIAQEQEDMGNNSLKVFIHDSGWE